MTFPCALIDGEALRHNLAAVRRIAPASRVMAIIKANAYGHGLIPTARALATADAFGVARLDEGHVLRSVEIQNEIVLLEGVFAAEELQSAAQQRFQLVVHSFEQLQMLEAFTGPYRFTIWLKVDTGMNRLGFRIEDFANAWQRLARCRSVAAIRLMTHLATAEERGNTDTALQIEKFRAISDQLNLERSIANSAGLLQWPEGRTEWVRPGLMLYGISPVPDRDAASLGLRAAMTLTTQLIAVRRVPAGEAVGYGGTWRVERDSLIGIAAIGYGDGYPRNVRTGAPIRVNERELCVVGRVSMDMTAIDLTDQPEAKIGDRVTVWGQTLPVERIAPYADTIAYELVCGISQRVGVEWRS